MQKLIDFDFYIGQFYHDKLQKDFTMTNYCEEL